MALSLSLLQGSLDLRRSWLQGSLETGCLFSCIGGVGQVWLIASLLGHHVNLTLLGVTAKLSLSRGNVPKSLLAAVSPLIFTNVSVWCDSRLYASDSSCRSGAFTWTEVGAHETKNLWRHADKKGSYTKLDSPVRLLLKELVPETELAEDFVSLGPFKSPLLYFDFVEFYGGAGVVSHHMSGLGWILRCTCFGFVEFSALWHVGSQAAWMVDPYDWRRPLSVFSGWTALHVLFCRCPSVGQILQSPWDMIERRKRLFMATCMLSGRLHCFELEGESVDHVDLNNMGSPKWRGCLSGGLC